MPSHGPLQQQWTIGMAVFPHSHDFLWIRQIQCAQSNLVRLKSKSASLYLKCLQWRNWQGKLYYLTLGEALSVGKRNWINSKIEITSDKVISFNAATWKWENACQMIVLQCFSCQSEVLTLVTDNAAFQGSHLSWIMFFGFGRKKYWRIYFLSGDSLHYHPRHRDTHR